MESFGGRRAPFNHKNTKITKDRHEGPEVPFAQVLIIAGLVFEWIKSALVATECTVIVIPVTIKPDHSSGVDQWQNTTFQICHLLRAVVGRLAPFNAFLCLTLADLRSLERG